MEPKNLNDIPPLTTTSNTNYNNGMNGDIEIIHKKIKLNDSNGKNIIKEENNTPQKQQLANNNANINNDNDNDNDNEPKKLQEPIRKTCPYLGTIKRQILDFDFEKLCSVTLTNLNVYACLICGKYYQGRGKNSHAYFHSLEQGHHVYINLHNCKIFCLPDNYEVDDLSLLDIKHNLQPNFTKEEVEKLDKVVVYARALDGTKYIPGCIGLNNVKATDYFNVIIQTLCRVPDLRNFFIFYEYKKHTSDVFDFKTLLTRRFAELVRKIWNPKNFKGHVSPHELLQAISLRSNKTFTIEKQSDAVKLLSWFLNELHLELQRVKRTENSNLSSKNYIIDINQIKAVISSTFRGEIEISTSDPIKKADITMQDDHIQYHSIRKPFMFLTLEIPPPPLYKDEAEKNIIPQIPLFNLLKKFDGITYTENNKGERIKYKISKLPKYLIFHMKRFTHNNFFLEKNPTIVVFPINNLDLKNYVEITEEGQITKYNLLASISHEGKPDAGIYKVYIRHKALDQWFEIQDLHINSVMPQQVALSEAYIQVYERHTEKD